MKKAVVFDLDGTLANIDHRLGFVQGPAPKNWDAFFGACLEDGENLWCSNLMEAVAQRWKVLVVSARPERCRLDTEQWLKDHAIVYDELVLVRKDGDHAPDDLLKQRWLMRYGPENILFVVDDRQRVVDMWRRNGVVCLQCNAWEETT